MINFLDIIPIAEAKKYKLHLACRNQEGKSPLDAYVSNPKDWLGWNQWRGKKNDWTREYVLSFMEFYPQADSWLFGGVFKVLDRHESGYRLEEIQAYKKFVGRLILSFHRYQGMRGRSYYLENHVNDFRVSQILGTSYRGECFPGIHSICHGFNVLEPIFKSKKADWQAALSNLKGVYLISDKNNGKHYVGSASGEQGIWSRWSEYISTGHGGNQQLKKIIAKKAMNYARKNFHFSLLETMAISTPEETILSRESHWKTVILSREYGYNSN